MKFIEPPMNSVIYSIRDEMIIAKVIDRPNRFLLNVEYNGDRIMAHIHDPGRLKELIYPGAMVAIRRTNGVKTHWSVTYVVRNDEQILLDTRFHNRIASSFIGEQFREEVPHGDSRYDFEIEHGYVEVKGCSMLVKNFVIFPDAPTKRGSKHLTSLANLSKEGYDCSLIFLILRSGAEFFYPNSKTDLHFKDSFFLALDSGVKMYFPKFSLVGNSIKYNGHCELGESPFGDPIFLKEFYSITQ